MKRAWISLVLLISLLLSACSFIGGEESEIEGNSSGAEISSAEESDENESSQIDLTGATLIDPNVTFETAAGDAEEALTVYVDFGDFPIDKYQFGALATEGTVAIPKISERGVSCKWYNYVSTGIGPIYMTAQAGYIRFYFQKENSSCISGYMLIKIQPENLEEEPIDRAYTGEVVVSKMWVYTDESMKEGVESVYFSDFLQMSARDIASLPDIGEPTLIPTSVFYRVNVRYEYEGTENTTPREAAEILAGMMMEGFKSEADDRTFSLIEYKNLVVDVYDTLEDDDEYEFFTPPMMENEMVENCWILDIRADFTYNGYVSGPGEADGDIWTNIYGEDGQYRLRKEGNTYILEDRM